MKPFFLRILVPVVIAFFFIAGCRNPEAPVYYDFVNFRLDSIGESRSVVSAALKYYNPNNYRMLLKDGAVDVYINQQLAGHSFLDSTIVIPRKDTFYLPVRMRIDMQVIAANALSIFLNNQVDIKLQGKARLGRSGVFKTVPIFYEGKQQLPDFLK